MTRRKTQSDYKGANTVRIGDAIQELLKTYHIKSKFDEANLVQSWERLVGKPVAKRTKKVYVRNKVLFVELDSPGMKNDLAMHKPQILDLFAREFGPGVISEIILM
jgi:predicted nucleic acid-binding Zn ribbon protein